MSILTRPPGVHQDYRLGALPPSRAKRPVRKPERSIRVLQPIDGDMPGHVQITVGSLTTDYTVDAVATDGDFQGQAYRLTKCSPVEDGGEPVYHVLLSRQGHQCECLGFLRHSRCKHVDGLLLLKEQGLI